MKILFLGYEKNPIIDFLREDNDVTIRQDLISADFVEDFDYVISYGYTRILKKDVIGACSRGIVNLHISYLPWNRGMHPNIWSFIEGTKKGVSIHFIDEGIDTGDILFQKEVSFTEEEDTFEKTYHILRGEIERLFMENWHNIVSGDYIRIKQAHTGTFHLKKDLEKCHLPNGWKTKTQEAKKHYDF